MQKWRGRAGRKSHAWRQLGRYEGSGANHCITHKPFIDQLRIMSCIEAVFRTLQSQVVEQDITRRTFKILRQGLPPHVYLTSACTWLSPRPSPSVFAYRKQSKTGARNGLHGNEAKDVHKICSILAHSQANTGSGEAWEWAKLLQCRDN